MTDFKTRLLSLRKQRDMTQLELANAIGVNKQTISQYERGVRRPDLEMLTLLCDFFNVSADYLLGNVDVTMRYVNSEELERLNNMYARALSAEELSLLKTYNSLNDEGKNKVCGYSSDLADNEKYQKNHAKSSMSEVG